MGEKENPAREDMIRRLREGLRRQPEVELITPDEYQTLKEIAAFQCPNGWKNMDGCDGHNCPTRGNERDPFSDYYWECREARAARRRLEAVTRGEVAVVSTGNGWTMPV